LKAFYILGDRLVEVFLTVSVTRYTKWEQLSLLKDGMSPAFAMVSGCEITSPIVVIQNEMLAFVAYDIRQAFKILLWFGDNE